MSTYEISADAIAWLVSGERGSSSDAIWAHMTGIPITRNRWSPPYDAADLRRCRELLAAVPEFRERLPEMAAIGVQWKVIVDNWKLLNDLYDCDVAEHGDRAPRVYQRMRELLERA